MYEHNAQGVSFWHCKLLIILALVATAAIGLQPAYSEQPGAHTAEDKMPAPQILLQPHKVMSAIELDPSVRATGSGAPRIATASAATGCASDGLPIANTGLVDGSVGTVVSDTTNIALEAPGTGQQGIGGTPSIAVPPQAPATGKPPGCSSLRYGLTQLLERNFGLPGYQAPTVEELPRRAPPPALDPIFPSTEFLGTNGQAPMGVNDANYAQYPLEQYLWKRFPILSKLRIRAYGWLNPGYNFGTSHHSNFPQSYTVAARQLRWDQALMRFERVPDTVQQDHMDWGFRTTGFYGEDYRFTTAKGWISSQLLKHNHLTGWDPVECYGQLYIPRIGNRKIFQGLQLRFGRYVSCPDIEAQLAPDNYIFSHSIMFTFDTYTQTGIQAWLQLNKYWNVMAGFHSGADTAPWTVSSVPTGQLLIRWVSKSNKDSLYGGIDDINGMKFRNFTHPNGLPASQGKDNLQQGNVNWTHVFNRRVHTVSEFYYLWTWNALTGGTVSNGPVRKFGGGGGPGAFIPGNSQAIGFVNYTLFKMTDRDYICLRPLDYFDDPDGWRAGYKTWYTSHTLGWVHRFSDTLCVRPEIRWEASHGHATPYNNGTKRSQFTFLCDVIQRF